MPTLVLSADPIRNEYGSLVGVRVIWGDFEHQVLSPETFEALRIGLRTNHDCPPPRRQAAA